jgi:hypothetical protein
MKASRILIPLLFISLAAAVYGCTSPYQPPPVHEPTPQDSGAYEAPETISLPGLPTGPSSGTVGQDLGFETGGAISSAGNSLKYIFDWGDGTYTETDFAVSGQDMFAIHTWNSPGTYYIRVKAQSSSGISSSWSPEKRLEIIEPQPVEHSQVLGTLQDYKLSGGYFHHWAYRIEAGKQASISWEADGSVSVYILTETQYDYFKTWGLTARYVAYQNSQRGTLSTKIANTDTYYFVIKNSSLFETYKIYSAEVKVTWWS